jgi:lysophospholipase L1-like esterase
LRATFSAASQIALVIDREANAGCPPQSMPVVEYSIDEEPYKVASLTETSGEYLLILGDGLDPALPHRVEVIFRAADLTNGRWTKTASRLRLVGFQLNQGAEVEPTAVRPKRVIGFGDSITEGVGGDGKFTSWQKLQVNNARATWLPMVAGALDAEYGQLGSGGQGMVRALELPALTETWSRYDAESSRLIKGKLLPEPDYIFCAMGTNDFEAVITEQYLSWLLAVRNACPAAYIFCIVPPLQVHAGEIASAVATRREEGDTRVHLVETTSLADEYRANQGPTRLAYDGVHPSVYGQARLAALVAAKAGMVIGKR